MEFDVNNRKIKEKKMDEFINKTKFKINENERNKIFNRLIEDAIRRKEADKNIKLFNEQKEDTILTKIKNINWNTPNKKYDKDEWKEIYQKRFILYIENKNKKIKEKIIEKEINEKKKEDYYINLNKNKKKPEKYIIQFYNKMYNEYKKKKEKMNQRKKDLEIPKNERNISNYKIKKKVRRNKSTRNNKKENNYIFDDDNFMKNNNNLINKKEKLRNNKCFTPPSSLSNRIEFKKNRNQPSKINHINIGKSNIAEALIETFFIYKNNL